MLSVTSQLLRQKCNLAAVLSSRRCFFLKPISLSVRVLYSTNDPCGCGTTKASGGATHRISYVPYKAPPSKQHDYKNMDLGRPMSPHLTIYAPTLPAMTSIVQRITGIILVFYAVMLSGGALFLSNGVETYVSMIQSLDLNRFSILLIKLILGAPFAFHYFNGIRFCMWNTGRWMMMKEVYETARKCFILTAVLTLLFALI